MNEPESTPSRQSYLLEIRVDGGSAIDKPISIPFESALDTLPLAQAVLSAIAAVKPKKTRSDAGVPRKKGVEA